MAKTGSRKSGTISKSSKRVPSSKVLGTTKDGVRILKPRGQATHFTQKELLGAVTSARLANKP